METNEYKKSQNNEANMEFDLASDLHDKVAKMALSMGEEEEARLIPGAHSAVLVRVGSTAEQERKDRKGVFMIPLRLKTTPEGDEKDFLVCTK